MPTPTATALSSGCKPATTIGGWTEFEWGWNCGELKPWLHCDQPLWDGGSLAGRTLLLHAEQGFGDTIQFVHFIRSSKARGAVVLQCQPALRNLLTGLPGIDRLVTQDDPLPAFDLHLPLLSVPRVLGTTLATIPAAVPYLTVDAARREYWKHELAKYPGFKIGVCWQGNPGLGHDRQRSVRLVRFAPLAAIPGVQFFSVQKGNGAEQLTHAPFPIVDPGRHCDDFSDTAAALVNLDLVVSVDTAVAIWPEDRIADVGAVAARLGLALAAGAERFTVVSDRALFRQQRLDDWGAVFAELHAALHADANALNHLSAALIELGRAGEAVGLLGNVPWALRRIPPPPTRTWATPSAGSATGARQRRLSTRHPVSAAQHRCYNNLGNAYLEDKSPTRRWLASRRRCASSRITRPCTAITRIASVGKAGR